MQLYFSKAFRRHLENKGGIPTIILLSGEKFAGKALPDRLLFKKYYVWGFTRRLYKHLVPHRFPQVHLQVQKVSLRLRQIGEL